MQGALTLTPKQIQALRQIPVAESLNRVGAAVEMAGVTQSRVAEATGVNESNLSQIINGRYSNVKIETARRLADYFGCHIEDLFPSREVA